MTAINSGADAIYLELKDFNACGRAESFSLKELKSLMPLARSKNVKILVTLNNVLKDQLVTSQPILRDYHFFVVADFPQHLLVCT